MRQIYQSLLRSSNVYRSFTQPDKVQYIMKFTTLSEWLAWQETLHPQAIAMELSRVAHVYQHLALSFSASRVITIAGTNGKGSVVAYLETILHRAGFRVGAYVSPHLLRYNERVRINTQPVTDQALCDAFEQVAKARGDIDLTYFEFATLAALQIFAGQRLDFVILEVGMGGRLDAVNVVDADVAVITNVDLDHQAWLGNDIETIAAEKAGIIRAARPVIYGEPVVPNSVQEKVREVGAHLLQLGVDFQYTSGEHDWQWQGCLQTLDRLNFPRLAGGHQLGNAACALAALEQLAFNFRAQEAAVREGIVGTNSPARCQIIAGPVERVFDVAHNPLAARALAAMLRDRPVAGRQWAVFGVLADKDVLGIVAPLVQIVDGWYVGTPAGERALAAAQLEERLQHAFPRASVLNCDKLSAAYAAACAQAVPGDRIVVFGSFYTVSELFHLNA